MPTKFIKNNLNAGEISEQLAGRTDYSKYYNACFQASNGIVLPWGGITKRPGTEFIVESKGISRLFRFEFSVTDTMVIVGGEKYFRFVQNDNYVTITKASVSAWAGDTEYSVDDKVSSGGSYYYCIDPHTSHETDFSADSDKWVEMTESGDDLVYEILSPYSATEIFRVHTATIGDVVYMAHTLHEPRKLTRFADNDWSVDIAEFTGGPFLTENTNDDFTLGFARTSGSVRSGHYFPKGAIGTLTATGHSPFIAQHVGSIWLLKHTRPDNVLDDPDNVTNAAPSAGIRIKGDFSFETRGYGTGDDRSSKLWRKAGNGDWQEFRTFQSATAYSSTEVEDDVYYSWTSDNAAIDGNLTGRDQVNKGIVRITEVTSPTVAQCEVVRAVVSNNTDDDAVDTPMWAEGAWSDYRGYPVALTFYQDRLFWGGTIFRPQTIWGSRTADYENHEIGVAANEAVILPINDNDVSGIEWLAARKYLIAGTSNKEYKISAKNSDDPITPTDAGAEPQSSHGSASLQPVILNDGLFYTQKLGRRMRIMNFSYETESMKSDDVNKLAPHIFELSPVDLDIQRTPDSVVWVVREDGTMCLFVINADEEIVAWTRCVSGSTLDRPEAKFRSVAITAGDIEDQVWVTVERIVGGETKYYIEKFATRYIDQIDQAMMLDSAKVVKSGESSKSIVLASDTVRYGEGTYGSSYYGGTYGS